MREIIKATADTLHAAGIDESRLKAELLISHAAGVPRWGLYTDAPPPGADELARLVKRALTGEPIQYVLGYTEFCGHRIKTDARALIPRPETEELVEQILADPVLWARPNPAIVDVCTGSGCIAIALALARPQASVRATDISEPALELARENARALRAGVEFALGDLLSGLKPNSLDAVVSNPPYVETRELSVLQREVSAFEPRAALDGGPDGLRIIARLAVQAFHVLRRDGKLWMEIGEDQAERVLDILRGAGFAENRVLRDTSGHHRMVAGCKP